MMPTKNTHFIAPLDDLESRESRVRIAFWWVGPKRQSALPKLIYGSVMPARGSTSSGWQNYNVAEKSFAASDGTGFKTRIVRLSSTCLGRQAWILLHELRAGKTLGQASKAAGLFAPEKFADQIPIERDWMLLPPFYFPTKAMHLRKESFAVGRASPTDAAGCYCERVCPPNRLHFLSDQLEPDESLRWLAEHLKKETGLEFASGAADAFGAVEIFNFPSLDVNGRSLVDVAFQRDTDKGRGTVTVSVTRDAHGGPYFVQLRTELTNDVATDQLAPIDAETGEVTFQIPDPVDSVVVRIWSQYDASTWTLWHEQEDHFIRSIGVGMNVVGLTGKLDSDWLKTLDGSRAASRADAFRAISQVAITLPTEISSRENWETSIQMTRAAVARVHPTRSDGHFFKKGWAGDHRLDFAEWLRERLSRSGGNVVLVDPYFDVSGLDLVSRASGAASELVVLTCTQIRSVDDHAHESARANRLSSSCQHLQTILQGVKLRLLDLRSRQGGRSQLFHDRYLMLYGADGNVKQGFNLSTSLQSATLNTPLLVTPVPDDVIDDVAEYVATLLRPGANGPNEIIVLHPSPPKRRTGSGLTNYRGHAALRFVNVMLGEVLSDDTDACAVLIRRGMLASRDDISVEIATTPKGLDRVRNFLRLEPLKDASLVWDGAVEAALSGWHGGVPEILAAVCPEVDAKFCAFLIAYLKGHAIGDLQPKDNVDHVTTLAHVFNGEFQRVVNNALNMLDHHHPHPIGTSWGIHGALLCLNTFYVPAMDELVADLIGEGERAHAVLSAIAGQAATAGQMPVETWLAETESSQVPYIRALSAMATWREFQRGTCTWEQFTARVATYAEIESQEILARCIFSERVRTNQAGSKGKLPRPRLPEDLTHAFVHSFSESISIERALELVPVLSGPLNGDWSDSTQNDLLLPLVNRQLLDPDAPFLIWNAIIQEKMAGDHFSAPVDSILAQVWGGAFWSSPDALRDSTIRDAETALRRPCRDIMDPFLQSRDFDRWRSAVDIISWWQLLLWGALRSAPEDAETPKVFELSRSTLEIVDAENIAGAAIGQIGEVTRWVSEQLRSLLEGAEHSSGG